MKMRSRSGACTAYSAVPGGFSISMLHHAAAGEHVEVEGRGCEILITPVCL